MTILLLPDCIISLAFLALVIVLLDKTTGRILIHLDTLRTLVSKAGFDLVALFAGWEQAKLDVERNTDLVEFEQKTLASIGKKEAVEMLQANRRLMQR